MPGKPVAAILVVDRSRADAAYRHAAWMRGLILVAGWLVVSCIAWAWRATVRLAEARGRARRLEVEASHFRDLSRAAAGLTHETFNPLGLIRGWTQRLAERQDDILPLTGRLSAELARAPVRLSPQAMQCLLTYSWPGNIRELRNAIQRACLLCRGDIVLPEHLPPKVAAWVSGSPGTCTGRLSQVERAAILATLEECYANRTQATKKLGISRRALICKLPAIEEEE